MFLSGGAAAMNLVLAANALGYGTNWITNWYSDTEEGRRILGLAPHERVVGFVHIGTFAGTVPERPRPDIAATRFRLSRPVGGMSACSTNRRTATACRTIRSRRSSRRGRSAGSRRRSPRGRGQPRALFVLQRLFDHPFLVWFASDGVKDSATFARDSGEFVVNLVGSELAEKMNASSVDAPRGVSEFGYAGLRRRRRCWSRRRAWPARPQRSNAR